MNKLDRVVIVGVGLLGGSLGLALKEKEIAKRVIGIGRRETSLRVALDRKEVDEITTDLLSGIKNADLIIISIPLELTVAIVKKIASHLKNECVITDVGSVKGPIVSEIENPLFVGGHPLSGSEKKGPQAARADLFKDATVVLTPVRDTDERALSLVKGLWQEVGAKVLFLSPKMHDELVAFTSHLPHILATSLTNLIGEVAEKEEKVLSLMGEGFRDVTRITVSPPSMWKEICLANRKEILSAIARFKKVLSEVEKVLFKEDGDKLLRKFEKGKQIRNKV